MSASRNSDAEVLVACLARHRRRWTLVRAMPAAGVALVIAASAGVVIQTISTAHDTAATLWMPLLAAAVATAAVALFVRRPSIRDTAAALDRRLKLNDRLVTGLQYAGATDAFAALVVRDAASCAATISPAAAFPYALPRTARAVVVLAIATAGVFMLEADSGWLTLQPDAGGGIGASVGPVTTAATETRRPGNRAAVDVTRNVAAATRVETQAERATERLRDTPRRVEGTRDARTDRTIGNSAISGSQARQALGAPAAADGPATAAAGTSVVDLSARSTGAGGAGRSLPRAAALAQDEVPVDLQGYVKRYFAAIHQRTSHDTR